MAAGIRSPNSKSKSSNSGRIFLGILILILLAVYSTKDWIDELLIPISTSDNKVAVEDDYQRNASSILSMASGSGGDNNANEDYKTADMERAYTRFHRKNVTTDAPSLTTEQQQQHMHHPDDSKSTHEQNNSHSVNSSSSTHPEVTSTLHNVNSSKTSDVLNATIPTAPNSTSSGLSMLPNASLILPSKINAVEKDTHYQNETTSHSSTTYNATNRHHIKTSASTFQSSNTTFIELPIPDTNTKPPISLAGCCGIGHRLGRNIPSMVYAMSHHRLIHVNWTSDVNWNVLFNDTPQIQQGPMADEHYGNEFPEDWNNNSSLLTRTNPLPKPGSVTAYRRYGPTAHQLFEMPLAQSIVKSLSDNLSQLVLSFLEPIRSQYANKKKQPQQQSEGTNEVGLHLCVHIRQGNNETGDWEKKDWRHIDFESTLNRTLAGMMNYTATMANTNSNASSTSSKKVSVFVASDNAHARTWFGQRTSSNNKLQHWHIIQPKKTLPRPKSGVWFGELTSSTNSQLSKEQLNEAMAEAVADVFALGECDALFIPNYSSFSVVGIMLARARRKKVYFHWWDDHWVEYDE